MAKSKARKSLERNIREGKLDPRIKRGSWNGVNPITKSIPNKKKHAATLDDYDRAS